jgi:hypothetical protein
MEREIGETWTMVNQSERLYADCFPQEALQIVCFGMVSIQICIRCGWQVYTKMKKIL